MASLASIVLIAVPVITYYVKVITGGSYLLLFFVLPIPFWNSPTLNDLSIFLLFVSFIMGFVTLKFPVSAIISAILGVSLYFAYGYTYMLIYALVAAILFLSVVFEGRTISWQGVLVRVISIAGTLCVYLVYTDNLVKYILENKDLLLALMEQSGILYVLDMDIYFTLYILITALTLLTLIVTLIRGASISTAVFSILNAIVVASPSLISRYLFHEDLDSRYLHYAVSVIFLLDALLSIAFRKKNQKNEMIEE